ILVVSKNIIVTIADSLYIIAMLILNGIFILYLAKIATLNDYYAHSEEQRDEESRFFYSLRAVGKK
ncbi:MAG: hypothetical protein Q8L88_10240, partial [Bacteroidota bacterium]|nr:hypothetical protein [Bacteroidota bacterium]